MLQVGPPPSWGNDQIIEDMARVKEIDVFGDGTKDI